MLYSLISVDWTPLPCSLWNSFTSSVTAAVFWNETWCANSAVKCADHEKGNHMLDILQIRWNGNTSCCHFQCACFWRFIFGMGTSTRKSNLLLHLLVVSVCNGWTCVHVEAIFIYFIFVLLRVWIIGLHYSDLWRRLSQQRFQHVVNV